MGRRALLLRGINLGRTRRVPMAELRDLFAAAGHEEVRTYLQSGNVVLCSDDPPAQLERDAERLIAERFSFEVPVVVRTGAELAEIVARNPLRDVARDPKRYQVSFLSAELDDRVLDGLAAVAHPSERLEAVGRELYAWHPNGVARSKLWAKLAGTGLGVKATARNWATVAALEQMASE